MELAAACARHCSAGPCNAALHPDWSGIAVFWACRATEVLTELSEETDTAHQSWQLQQSPLHARSLSRTGCSLSRCQHATKLALAPALRAAGLTSGCMSQ